MSCTLPSFLVGGDAMMKWQKSLLQKLCHFKVELGLTGEKHPGPAFAFSVSMGLQCLKLPTSAGHKAVELSNTLIKHLPVQLFLQ